MFESNSVTDDKVITKARLSEMVEIGTLLIKNESPQIAELATIMSDDGVIYDGKIVIKDPDKSLERSGIEAVLHQLKHCFKGDYLREDGSERVPAWMVDYFRAKSGKHNRVSIAYTVTMRDSDGSLVINFHRSMGKGVSGAHRLCKVTSQNLSPRTRKTTWYNEQLYYVVPLATREVNDLMQLFASMAAEALEAHIFECEANQKPFAEQKEELPLTPQINFGTAMPATI